jgi:hypothetical protein
MKNSAFRGASGPSEGTNQPRALSFFYFLTTENTEAQREEKSCKPGVISRRTGSNMKRNWKTGLQIHFNESVLSLGSEPKIDRKILASPARENPSQNPASLCASVSSVVKNPFQL